MEMLVCATCFLVAVPGAPSPRSTGHLPPVPGRSEPFERGNAKNNTRSRRAVRYLEIKKCQNYLNYLT